LPNFSSGNCKVSLVQPRTERKRREPKKGKEDFVLLAFGLKRK
jgi:hypothetical protein